MLRNEVSQQPEHRCIDQREQPADEPEADAGICPKNSPITKQTSSMKEIRESDTLRRLWEKYSREYEYAKAISFDDTCNTIQTIMDAIMV